MRYMRDGLDDSYGILQLQNKILELAVYLDGFCEQHGIDYCLMGGSALGAKRHGGFIPWDDDLDIFMTRSNYDKFRAAFSSFGDHARFYLQECGKQKNGMVTVPKLRMNHTTYMEELTKDWSIHQGVFIDIFILHNCPNKTLEQLWQCFWAKCVVVKGMSLRGYARQTGIRKFFLGVAHILPRKLMIEYGLKQVYRFQDKDSRYYCNFLGKAVYKKGIYRREWFEYTTRHSFENVLLRVPAGLEAFLSERFGNYMRIPSQDRIKWEQHVWKWDVEKDYTAYTGTADMHDEKNLV